MSEVRNDEQKEHKYSNPEMFYSGQKLLKYFSSLRVRGTSLFTCSYTGEPCNGRKFKCYENKPFIVFILVLRRALFYICFFKIQFEVTAVGMNST